MRRVRGYLLIVASLVTASSLSFSQNGLFVENIGQYPPEVLCSIRTQAGTIWLLEGGLLHQLFGPSSSSVTVEMSFVDGNPVNNASIEEFSSTTQNVILGADRRRWVSAAPTGRSVRYSGIYDGIDLRLYISDSGRVQYDWLLQPGAHVESIQLKVRGATEVSLREDGSLCVETVLGQILQSPPKIFQDRVGGPPLPLEGKFELAGNDVFGFSVSGWTGASPLTIDPEFTYATYLGGSFDENHIEEFSGRVHHGPGGTLYSFGGTFSADFPVTMPGSVFQAPCDVFLAKFEPNGNGSNDLVWSTIIGGNGAEEAWGLKVDPAGRCYITGQTASDGTFPPGYCAHETVGTSYLCIIGTTGYMEYGTLMAGVDGFCVDLYPDYPSSAWTPSSCGVDPVGDSCSPETTGYFVCVTGIADTSFETTPGAFSETATLPAGGGFPYPDAFLRIYSPDLSCIAYSTYLGSIGFDESYDMLVDNGIVYLCGAHGYGPENAAESYDCSSGHFPLKRSSAATGPILDSVFGSTGQGNLNEGYFLALDPTPGVADPLHCNLAWDKLKFSTYVGGDGGAIEYAFTLALHPAGYIYVVGTTASDVGFPVVNPFPSPIGTPGPGPGHDGFVAKFSLEGDIQFCSYFSGTDNEGSGITTDGYEWVYGVQVDPSNPDRFWIAGQTESSSYSVDLATAVSGAFQQNLAGGFDMFLARITEASGPPAIDYFTYLGGSQDESQKNMIISDSGDLYIGGWSRSTDFPTSVSAYDTSSNGGSDVVFARFDIADRFIRGDADHDGDVDLEDSKHIAMKLPLVCHDAADANDDGRVDAADAAYLTQYINSNGQPPGTPFPACGHDPTADSLKACMDTPVVCP